MPPSLPRSLVRGVRNLVLVPSFVLSATLVAGLITLDGVGVGACLRGRVAPRQVPCWCQWGSADDAGSTLDNMRSVKAIVGNQGRNPAHGYLNYRAQAIDCSFAAPLGSGGERPVTLQAAWLCGSWHTRYYTHIPRNGALWEIMTISLPSPHPRSRAHAGGSFAPQSPTFPATSQ